LISGAVWNVWYGAGDGTVRAAGGVVWRDGEKGTEILLVHRGRYDDWSFPKGKLDPGESWKAGARREVEEETGVRPTLGPELLTSMYRAAKGRAKTVRYWAMTAKTAAPFVPNDEVDEIAWLRPAKARKRLTYARDRDVLDSFLKVTGS
jgi:8-oxo-dGTP diphosphatase